MRASRAAAAFAAFLFCAMPRKVRPSRVTRTSNPIATCLRGVERHLKLNYTTVVISYNQ